MSEFLAEARILVRPDTSRFRRDLEAQLQSVLARPVKIPVVPVVSAGFAAAAAGTTAFTAAQQSAAAATVITSDALATATTIQRQYAGAVLLSTGATEALTTAQLEEAAAATTQTAANARAQAGFIKGTVAQGAALLGLRAGTLAASSAFVGGTVAVLGFAKAVQSAAELETELNVFQATAAATADEMVRVSDAAKALGRDITLPGVTAGSAAIAMTELAKAGLSVKDSLDGARGVLQLATAAQIDVADATQLTAGALNSFGLAGNEAVKVADLLTGAAKESQGEISDMGTALAQASAVSHQFGVSIEDTITLLTELAQAGISGGRAGTSLRVAFLRLVNPPKDAAKALKELNVQIRDSQGRLRPQIFTDIQHALEGYTKAQRDATLATIFGSDAIRTAAIIGAKGPDAFNETRAAVTEYGLAQDLAAARTKGLQGNIENLKNQVSSLGLTLGQAGSGPVGAFVSVITDMVELMNLAATGAAKAGGEIKGLGESIGGAIPFADRLVGSFQTLHNLLGGPIGGIRFAADLAHALGAGADEVDADAKKIRRSILDIIAAGEQTGGDLGLNQALVNLDLLVESLRKGGPEAQKMASAVAELRRKLQEAGTTGFKLFPDDPKKLFPPLLLSGEVSRKVGETNKEAFVNAIPGNELFAFTKEAFDNVTKAIEVSGADAIAAAKRLFQALARASTEELSKIGEQFSVAVAEGSRSGQLSALRSRLAELSEIRDAADKLAKDIGAGNKGFATAVAKRRQAQDEIASVNQQIRGIEEQIASDAEKTKQDVITARNKADQAFLDAVSFQATNIQNRIIAAAGQPGVLIALNKVLRARLIQARKDAVAGITDAKTEAQAVQSYTSQINQITNSINDLVAQQVAAQKASRAAQQRAAEESLQLDVSFAQTNNNKAGEISARERLIVQLKKEQALVKRGTNEWKRLRNEIAEENAAIKALNKEKQSQKNLFGEMTFQFLQDQQGFASNLLGNLIPTSAAGGLVGGGSAVDQALNPVSAFADGQSKSGPTSGQAQTTNGLLGSILQQLKTLNGDNVAPEATRQNSWQRSTMDYHSG